MPDPDKSFLDGDRSLRFRPSGISSMEVELVALLLLTLLTFEIVLDLHMSSFHRFSVGPSIH